jgi:hypothetical protein
MVDTRGPEIRIRQFKNGKVELVEGQDFAITTENLLGDETIVSVTYSKLPSIVRKGTKILLNDGLIELVVESKTDNVIYTKVVVGGELTNNKSINIPSVELNMEYLSDIDKSDIEFAVEENVDVYSISFVNHASDVAAVKDYLKSMGVENPFIISKIESAKSLERIDEIIAALDAEVKGEGTYVDVTVTEVDGKITATAVTAASGVVVVDSSNKVQKVTDMSKFRTIIGAGTSSLTLGTTATTAAKGNHTHASYEADITAIEANYLRVDSSNKLVQHVSGTDTEIIFDCGGAE